MALCLSAPLCACATTAPSSSHTHYGPRDKSPQNQTPAERAAMARTKKLDKAVKLSSKQERKAYSIYLKYEKLDARKRNSKKMQDKCDSEIFNILTRDQRSRLYGQNRR